MGVAPDSVVSPLLILPVAAAVPFVALVAAARGLRWLYRQLDRRLRRWIGPRAADVLTGAIIVVGTVLVVNGVLVDGAVRLADHAFSLQNEETEPGVTTPGDGLRSGGPGSLVAWDSLGRYGRSFAAGGPTAQQIAQVTGTTAQTPIRAYAGLDSAAGVGGAGPPRRRRPATGRRVLPVGAGRRHHHRLGLDRPGVTRHAGVPDRGRLRRRHDAVLVPAVVAVVPGRPGPRARRRPGAVRRRLRPLGRPARERPPAAVRLRREPRLVRRRRRRSAASTTCATARRARCSSGRPRSTRSTASSSAAATPAAPRWPRSSAAAGPSASTATRPVHLASRRPPASRGPTPACSTCCTRRTRS